MKDNDGKGTAARLYDDHADRVYRFCYRLSGNATVAEDLAAETFFSVLDARFRGEAEEMTFLYKVALNKWRMHCRRQFIRRRLESLGHQRPGPEPDLRVTLDAAIDGLPGNLRVAFILVKVEGFTSKEAAELLECPTGTVQSRVFKACERLRAALSEAPLQQSPAVFTPAEENGK